MLPPKQEEVSTTPEKLALAVSPLDSEVRASLLRTAAEQGIEGHRRSLVQFSKLLLLHGAIQASQLTAALELVDVLFDRGVPYILAPHR